MKTREDVAFLVRAHDAALINGTLQAKMDEVPQALRGTTDYLILRGIAAIQRATTPDEWSEVYDQFHKLYHEQHRDLFGFSKVVFHSYLFLCRWKLQHDPEKIQDAYEEAVEFADVWKHDPGERLRWLGFLEYHWSCYQREQGNRETALFSYYKAGAYRIRHYKLLREIMDEDPEGIVRAAATRVWEIRNDWGKFFPDVPINFYCIVTPQLFREVEEVMSAHHVATPE